MSSYRRLLSALPAVLALVGPAYAVEDAGAGAVVSSSAHAITDAAVSELPDDALAAILAPLESGDEKVRRAAVAHALALGPEATDALGRELGRLRRDPAGIDGGARALLKAARSSQPRSDLLEALVRADPKTDVDRATLRTVCTLRALAHIGTPEAVLQLVLASGDDAGGLREEIDARLHDLGERAIPGLIRARRGTSFGIARWASGELEGMNRRAPGDCVQTKDPTLLADVLRAFAAIRDPDAVGVVVSFVNADRDLVRLAARDAVLAYGPLALPRLREAYASIAEKPAPPEWDMAQTARALFEVDDELRLQDVHKLIASGLHKAEGADLAGAVADYDKALARQPDLERREELAPTYVTYALSIEDTDRPRAVSYLRKAIALAPAGTRAAQAQAEIAFLEAEDLRAHGVIDEALYNKAVSLDPTHTRARAAIDQAEIDRADHNSRIRQVEAAFGVLALVITGLVLFVGRRRKLAGA